MHAHIHLPQPDCKYYRRIHFSSKCELLTTNDKKLSIKPALDKAGWTQFVLTGET